VERIKIGSKWGKSCTPGRDLENRAKEKEGLEEKGALRYASKRNARARIQGLQFFQTAGASGRERKHVKELAEEN